MKKLLLISLFSLIGCEDVRRTIAPNASEQVNDIAYVKDSRTNLCFVVSRVSEYPVGTADVFSNVPCSPEVEKLATIK